MPPPRSNPEPLGLPSGWKIYTPGQFAGLNQQDDRSWIADQEFYWRENFIRVGNGDLRSTWDVGTPLYTSPSKVILCFFWFNIAAVQYAAVFFTDGTAIQVNGATGEITVMSNTVGTFTSTGFGRPACCQSGSQYLLISNNNTANSYWIWDGALLYGAGGLGPTVTLTSGGQGYTSAPTVTAVGGHGSGATFSATIANGSVVNVVVTNPGSGYVVGDQVQLVFSGGGSDSGAILQAVLTTATIGAISLLSGGSGYTSVPTVSITGGGSGATATAVIGGGGVVSVAVGAGGTGYTTVPTVNLTGGGGSGAQVVAVVTAGAVTSFMVTVQGSGYTSAPTVVISGGGGTGATGTATIAGTSVTGITVTDPGSGYTDTPTIGFSGGGGTGADAVAILNSGSVASVNVVDGGTGYNGATPTLTFQGGGGSGAMATASITGGAISSVNVDNGGSGYTSAPSVVVQTATNNSAAGFAELMPFGVSGSSMETYNNRVWLPFPNETGRQNNGGTFLVSAPESLVDFATSDGGLIFTSTDRFLRAQYTAIRQSNSYLYPFGDSSVAIISNVQTVGNPSTTTFNYQNTDPQIGTGWRDSLQDFGRTVLFANPLGIFGLYGGAVTKVSQKLDKLFANLPVSSLVPSSAVMSIQNIKCYLLLITILDPTTQTDRVVMLTWDEKDWFVSSQSPGLTFVGTQEVNSTLFAWGTDGTSLYPLFNTPSNQIRKKLSSKLYGANTLFVTEQLLGFYLQAFDNSTNQIGVHFTATIDSEADDYVFETQPVFPTGNAGGNIYGNRATDVYRQLLGFSLSSISPDFTITNAMIAYADVGSLYGSNPGS